MGLLLLLRSLDTPSAPPLIGRGGLVRRTARLLLTDRHGEPIDDITSWMLGGSVDLDIDRTVSPFLLRGELRAAGIVDAYRDHIQPWLRLEYPNGAVVDEPLGLYAVAPPPRRLSYRRTTELVTGHDHTWRLATSSFPGAYTVPAAVNVVDQIIVILMSEGFTAADIDIDPSPQTLSAAITWGVDQPATKLAIVNQLSAAIGYCPVHTRRQGPLRGFALPDLEAGAPSKVYRNESGEVTAEISEDPDEERICNVVRVVNARNGAEPIVAIAENHDPASPLSIENLGRVLLREVQDANIPDQATAALIAQRTLQAGATYDNQVTITTAPDPTRNPYESYEFQLTQGGGASVLSGRWRCRGWSIDFPPAPATMTHRIGRVMGVESLLGAA